VCLGVLMGCWLLFPATIRLESILQALLFSVQLFLCLQTAGWDRSMEIPGGVLGFGVAVHVTGQVLLLTDWGAGYPGWMLRLSLYGFTVFAMLSSNRRTLNTAYGKWGTVPISLSRRNALLVVGLSVIALLGSMIPSAAVFLQDVIVKALRWIGAFAAALFSKLDGPSADAAAEDIPAAMGPGGDNGRMLVLPPLLEKIILFIGALLSIAFLAYILWRVGKKIVKAVRDGWDAFGKFLSGASEDYVDEVSDTRDTGTSERLTRRSRKPSRYREDPTLPPDQQIRSRYRYIMGRHPEWAPGATAREKLPEDAAAVYERTRYSSHGASAEDVLRFKESLGNL